MTKYDKISKWLTETIESRGDLRFDDLHVDQVDPELRKRELWVHGGMECFQLALNARDVRGRGIYGRPGILAGDWRRPPGSSTLKTFRAWSLNSMSLPLLCTFSTEAKSRGQARNRLRRSIDRPVPIDSRSSSRVIRRVRPEGIRRVRSFDLPCGIVFDSLTYNI